MNAPLNDRSLVTPGIRRRVRRLGEPIALFLGRLGLTPNALTILGFLITIAGAGLLAAQQWLVGGLVVFGGGVFDLFDGSLARATGRVSPLGAFMDSVFDRWGEAVVYVGIAVGAVFAGLGAMAALAAATMAAAFMVSYVRAKAEGLGFTPGAGMAQVGLMPREVRLVVLTVGLVWGGLVGVEPMDLAAGALVIEAALGLIAVLATITVIQRILHVRAQARRAP